MRGGCYLWPSKESSGEYFKQLFWEQARFCGGLFDILACVEAMPPNPGVFKGLETKWSFGSNILTLQI